MSILGKFLDGALPGMGAARYVAGEAGRNVGKVVKPMAHGAAEGAGKTAHFLKQASSDFLDARDDAIIKSMVKKTDPAFYNAYTGLKPTMGMNVAAFGAAGAYAYAGTLRAQTKPQAGTVEYEGQAPIMSGDGMQPTAGKAPTLGASGSLVFGLNAMRRG